jgi:transposase
MTPEHFTELVATIQLTTGMSDNEVGDIFNVSGTTIRDWKKRGVPGRRSPRIGPAVRAYFGRK